MSLRDATANSINTVFAQLVLDIGAETSMVEMAKKMGITAELGGYPAEVLGGLTHGVSVLQMSNAYATLANGGVHHDPTAIGRVEFPDGEVDEPEHPEGKRVITDGVAYEVADVMKGTLDYGTAACMRHRLPGRRARPAPPSSSPTRGSSATRRTSRPRSGSATRTRACRCPGYGADLAAPIWHALHVAAAAEPCDDFPAPKNPAEPLRRLLGEHTVSTRLRLDDDQHRLRHDRRDGRTDADTDGAPMTTASTTRALRARRRPGAAADPAGNGNARAAAPATARRRRRRRRGPLAPPVSSARCAASSS